VTHKPPGEYSRRKLRRILAAVLVLTGTVVALAVAGFWWWLASVMGYPLLWILWRESDRGGILDPFPHWRGRKGEMSVAAELNRLPHGYRVLNGIESAKGNVDHVVIGPTGVFAIETKNVSGTLSQRHGRLTKDGYDAEGVVTQAVAEAMEIRRRLRDAGLDRWVEAVLASVGASIEDPPLVIRHVAVLPASGLPPFILNRRVLMSELEIARSEAAILGTGQAVSKEQRSLVR